MRKKTITKKTTWISILILWLLIAQAPLFASESDSTFVPWYKYDFPKATKNELTDDAKTLLPFFNQLRALKDDSALVVSIAHIGDSHIQADIETGVIRRLFQDYFGSAGRGLIAPLKLIKTNEPRNYRIGSDQTWEGIRIIKPGTLPVGITGMVAINRDSIATVSVEPIDLYNPEKWSFNNMTVYYDTISSQLNISDSFTDVTREINTPYSQEIFLDTLANSIDLTFKSQNQSPILFYGVNLRNGRSGVLYHAIGINGAHYDEYSNAGLFMKQLPTLNASLFIISMGTNEAYDQSFKPETFYASIDRTIQLIREQVPGAVFILTTPAESWYRYKTKNKKPHPNMAIAHDVIVKYTQDHQMACWDLFSITGGKGSAKTWTKHKLFSHDGIHFSKEGYEYIGELFFEALYNAYRNSK